MPQDVSHPQGVAGAGTGPAFFPAFDGDRIIGGCCPAACLHACMHAPTQLPSLQLSMHELLACCSCLTDLPMLWCPLQMCCPTVRA